MIREETYTIRPLYATDLKHGFLETLEALTDVRLTLDEAIAVFQKRLREKVRTWVAVQGDRIIGTVALMIEPKFIHHGGMVGHIEDVAVHRDCQQQGIGAALVRHAIKECRGFQCYKVILDCDPRLIPYYERQGFRQWARAMRMDLVYTEMEESEAAAEAGMHQQ